MLNQILVILNYVSLRLTRTKQHFCAGTIIERNWILTAAHCLTHITNPEEFLIQYNSTELNLNQPQYAAVSEVNKHEGYNPTIAIHDIALIRLRDPINMTNISEIKIPNDEYMTYEETTGTLLGWGLNETNGVLASHLQKADLKIMSLGECRKRLESIVHVSNMCAEGVHRGQCSGDSGGPLLHEDIQIGLVSWSLKPCASKPGVFTNVSYYSRRIKEKLQL